MSLAVNYSLAKGFASVPLDVGEFLLVSQDFHNPVLPVYCPNGHHASWPWIGVLKNGQMSSAKVEGRLQGIQHRFIYRGANSGIDNVVLVIEESLHIVSCIGWWSGGTRTINKYTWTHIESEFACVYQRRHQP